MPRDANGNTSPIPGSIVATGDTVLPSQHNPPLVDLYAMMTQSLSRDGQGGMRSNLAMNGFRVTGSGTAVDANDLVTLGTVRDAMPIGVVVDFCGSTPPNGWMLCYGQAISRTAYPECFAALGVKFGSGDGSTTFNLPDFRGRASFGVDNMGGASANRVTIAGSGIGSFVGAVGGLEQIALQISQMPSHNHGGTVTPGGNHQHTQLTIPVGNAGPGSGVVQSPGNSGTPTLSGSTNFSGDHSHGINAEGGGQSHNNMPPTLVMNKIVKVNY